MKKLSLDELNRISPEEYKEASKLPVKIVLDDIRSLMNIGSFFRTGDAFRVEEIILCGITATPPHREIQKTALGATESVPWVYEKSALDTIKKLQKDGYKVFAVEQTENSLMLDQFVSDEKETAKGYALVFGNEVNGVGQELIDQVGASIEIPQLGTKHSFNVSVSAGIVLWEFYKLLREKI